MYLNYQTRNIMKKHIIIGVFTLAILLVVSSCKKYLDVVPDNIATIDNAFAMRSQAEKFLFTCYSYMPKDGDMDADPAMMAGDEIWLTLLYPNSYFNMARGFQNVVNPYGDNYWIQLYKAVRDCNIFLENIDRVPDITETEKRRWIAEVKFLKAYYHFYLVRMYGPIPLIKVNLPISADVNQVKVSRDPVDSCFNYITKLIDEAMDNLPTVIDDPGSETGRITKFIALAFKAKVLVTAASPLFNGNTDQSGLKNPDGTSLFNTVFSQAKWDSAAVACKRAIDIAQQDGLKLYYFQPDFQQFNLSDTIKTQMSIRSSITDKWNSEIIWGNTQTNTFVLQSGAIPALNPLSNYPHIYGVYSPPLKIVEMFYSQHGVPITEDKTWVYANRYSLQTAGDKDKLYIRKDYTTAALNFDREPRFYADLGFDGGIWYGQGLYDDKKYLDLYYVEAKFKQKNGASNPVYSTATGYFIKKLIHYQNVIGLSTMSVNPYPWPIMRLADLYLLYAEALNESAGLGPDVYKYVDLVRERAGLQSVESSWTNYSTNPTKYTTQNGMRDIIHQERLIELVFEGQRFWDLRRWKEASQVLNAPITGWDLSQESATAYYKPRILFTQTFGMKDYFWPINDNNITVDRNLVQNLGW